MNAAATFPWPRWIAHRGAGRLAPENTLAAFRLGAAHGWRMFECDVRLSRDGVPFLLHDHTLERTTNGHGAAGDWLWSDLARLDAGGWHGRAWAGEALPTLAALLRWGLANHFCLNVEIKPGPGTARQTGEAVCRLLLDLWPAGEAGRVLLSSFEPEALEAARALAPSFARALLRGQLAADGDGDGSADLRVARDLDCTALVLHYPLWDAGRVARARGCGLRCLAYTVNDVCAAQRLIDLGLDGIITDRVDLFCPGAPSAG